MDARGVRVAEIKRAVAAEYGITVKDLDGFSRARDFARPRQLAMSLALLMTRHSSVRVGQFFGNRDHSTVLVARKAVNSLISADPETRDHARNVLRELRRGA